jgi:hypothetical protein
MMRWRIQSINYPIVGIMKGEGIYYFIYLIFKLEDGMVIMLCILDYLLFYGTQIQIYWAHKFVWNTQMWRNLVIAEHICRVIGHTNLRETHMWRNLIIVGKC